MFMSGNDYRESLNKVDLVERLLERGMLTDETRKITRNRQPGRCCVEGCQVPAAPQMVPLPPPASARKRVELAPAVPEPGRRRSGDRS